jgi:hypothetical protein
MSKRAKVTTISCIAFLFAIYICSWFFLAGLNLISPMANLRYFHYGEYQKWSDKALYVLYYPQYWAETHLCGNFRYGLHWSDRQELKIVYPTDEELMTMGFTNEELKKMGFTDKEIKKKDSVIDETKQ